LFLFTALQYAPGSVAALADYDGRTPIHIAAACGHGELAKLLVQAGADVNARDRWGCTPVQVSVRVDMMS
jgi:glutaminase